MLYRVRWGVGDRETYQETFRSVHAVREALTVDGILTPGQIAELTVKGQVRDGEAWMLLEKVTAPPFSAEGEQRVREVTLLYSACFFLVLAAIGAAAVIGAMLQTKWSVHP